MPEPTDTLRERLAAAAGLPALLADARATWVARAERDADAAAELDSGAAVMADSVVRQDDEKSEVPAAGGEEVRRPTARWRAFEDAFPTFYQFTNRPRN